jgi:hypothetical protein
MRLRAGADDALGDGPGAAPRRLTWDDIRTCNPDIMIILCCGRSAQDAAAETAEHLINQPGFEDLPAMKVRPPRLYFIGHELCSRPSLRTVDGIEQLAALIHPDCFPAAWARDALQLQLGEAEDIPPQKSFASRCEPLQPGWKADTDDMFFRSTSWEMIGPSCKSLQAAASVMIGTPNDDMVFLPATLATKDVWYAAMSCGKILEFREQSCEAIVGTSVPTPRAHYASAIWGDILMVFGGVSPLTGMNLARLELLHLRTHCWTHGSTTGTLPPPRRGTTIVVDNTGSHMLVFGGFDGSKHFGDIHMLNLLTWHWELISLPEPRPRARAHHAACAWEGRGMVIHGGTSDQGDLSDVWLLHLEGPPSSWRWEELGGSSSALGARSKHSAFVLGDGLLIAGGYKNGGSCLEAHMFHLGLKTAVVLPDLPDAMVRRQGIVALSSGVIAMTQQEGSDTWDLHQLPHYVLWSLSGQNFNAGRQKIVQAKHSEGKAIAWDANQPLSMQDVQEKAGAGDEKALKALANIEKLADEKRPQARWAMLHRMANSLGREQYIDPVTGYIVFTATFLRKRPCCGNGCRHCPYGHVNVPSAGLAEVVQDW